MHPLIVRSSQSLRQCQCLDRVVAAVSSFGITNPLVSIHLTLFVVVIVVVAGVVYPLYGSSSAAMKRAARHFVLTELPCVREITPGCGGSVFVGFDCILSTNVMSYARASAHS